MDEKKRLLLIIFYFLFFMGYLTLGLFIYKDYGISWDEYQQRQIGLKNYDYIFNDDLSFLEFRDRDYGVAFELPLIFIEKALHLSMEKSRTIFLMRHLMNFCFFAFSVFCFYLMITLFYDNKLWGVVASLFLILSPPIFSHSFYNSKDIILLSAFIIATYTLLRYLKRKDSLSLLLHAVASSFLINIRVIGIIIWGLTILLLLLDRHHKKTLIYFMTSTIITYIGWPYLWKNPLKNFWSALTSAGKFRWEDSMIFSGEVVKSTQLPWNYIPESLLVTTPLLYTILTMIGILIALKMVYQNRTTFFISPNVKIQIILVQLTILLVPLSLIIIMRPVLYDSWRHFFFIYGAFLFFAILGLNYLISLFSTPRTSSLRLGLIFITGLSLLVTTNTMIHSHPYQHIYFNEWMTKDDRHLKFEYELDYWGTSYREALEWILINENINHNFINIFAETKPGILNSFILSPKARKRLVFVNKMEEANYFLLNYRYLKSPPDYLYNNKVYDIKVGNNIIMSIFKLKQTSSGQ